MIYIIILVALCFISHSGEGCKLLTYVMDLVGCRQLQDLEMPEVEVDPCGDPQSAAEGAVLGLFEYDELKQKKKTVVKTQLHGRYWDLF